MKIKKILAFMILIIMTVMLFSSCDSDEVDNGEEVKYTMRSRYTNRYYQSFVKLKVLSCDGELYRTDGKELCILIDCEVSEDYYGLLESGEKLTLAISTFCDSKVVEGDLVKDYFDTEILTELFSEEYLLAHIPSPKAASFFSLEGGTEYQAEKYSYVSFGFNQVFPITESGLDIQGVNEVLKSVGKKGTEEEIEDFSEYLRDGMKEEEIKASLNKLDLEIEEINKKRSDYGVGKFKTELVEIDSGYEGLSLTVDYIDVYLDYITVTMTNNFTSPMFFGSGGVDKEIDGEWNYTAVEDRDIVRVVATDEYKSRIDLAPGESCTFEILTHAPLHRPVTVDHYGKYRICLEAYFYPATEEQLETGYFDCISSIVIDVSKWENN